VRQVARQQVGRVGLHHQSMRGDVAHEFLQVGAAALVADPAGDADVAVEVEALEQLALAAGEAVHHHPRQTVAQRAQDGHEIIVRVALVGEQRLAGLQCDAELALEGELLRRARRIVAEVIEARFAYRAHLGLACQRAQQGVGVGAVVAGVVRVHAGGGVQQPRVAARERQRVLRALRAGAGDHHPGDAGLARPFEHGVQVVAEAFVGEVGADVDEEHGG